MDACARRSGLLHGKMPEVATKHTDESGLLAKKRKLPPDVPTRAQLLRSCKAVRDEVINHSPKRTTQWGRELAKRTRGPGWCFDWRSWVRQDHASPNGIVAETRGASGRRITSPTVTLVRYGAAPAAKVYHLTNRIERFHDFETLGSKPSRQPAVVPECRRFPLQSPWPQLRVKLELWRRRPPHPRSRSRASLRESSANL